METFDKEQELLVLSGVKGVKLIDDYKTMEDVDMFA